MTTLRFGHEGSYAVTTDDRLWLLRAVQSEGPPQLDVARALVNLFCYLRAYGDKRALADVVRAYAQPINPRWFTSGDLYVASLAKAGSPQERATLVAKAQTRERVHSTRMKFDAGVIDAVKRALEQPFPSDVTDYAASWVDATSKGYAPRSEPGAGRNRLWTRAAGWAGYWVERSGGSVAVLLVCVVVATALVLRKG